MKIFSFQQGPRKFSLFLGVETTEKVRSSKPLLTTSPRVYLVDVFLFHNPYNFAMTDRDAEIMTGEPSDMILFWRFVVFTGWKLAVQITGTLLRILCEVQGNVIIIILTSCRGLSQEIPIPRSIQSIQYFP